jgi:hypothetical protein
MGENGYRRLMSKYRIEQMQKMYSDIYEKFEDSKTSRRLFFVPLAPEDRYTEEAEYDKDYNGDKLIDLDEEGDPDECIDYDEDLTSQGNEKESTEEEDLHEIDDLVKAGFLRYKAEKSDDAFGDFDFTDYDEPTSLRLLIGAPDPSKQPKKEKKHGWHRRNAK